MASVDKKNNDVYLNSVQQYMVMIIDKCMV